MFASSPFTHFLIIPFISITFRAGTFSKLYEIKKTTVSQTATFIPEIDISAGERLYHESNQGSQEIGHL